MAYGMTSLAECYRILGVNIGAGIADVTSSYKRLCRIHHPDVSTDPKSEELMKKINAAYSTLREKFRNEGTFRDRQGYPRHTRRYTGSESRASSSNARRAGVEIDREAYAALYAYFKALSACDYSAAYSYLSGYDKQQTTMDSFIEWRESVARLYLMKEFFVAASSTGTTVMFNDGSTVLARKFHVVVNEDDLVDNTARSSDVEKLMISENGFWKVFLGYKGVGDLTRAFDERFEAERRRDTARRWEEYVSTQHPEFNMFSLPGMRKAVSRELYRQSRFGGTLTFAAIRVSDSSASSGMNGAGSSSGAGAGSGSAAGGFGRDARDSERGARENERNGRKEQLLRSTARTICAAMRETDVPAYAGDGVFMILFVELRRKHADEIIVRLTKKIRGNAGTRLGLQADIEYAFGSWSGSGSASIDAFNDVLKRFDKKM